MCRQKSVIESFQFLRVEEDAIKLQTECYLLSKALPLTSAIECISSAVHGREENAQGSRNWSTALSVAAMSSAVSCSNSECSFRYVYSATLQILTST